MDNKKIKTAVKDATTTTVMRIGSSISNHLPPFINSQIFILFCTILAAVLFFPYTSVVQDFDLPVVGEVADETIIAPFTFDILKSEDELKKDIKRARDEVLLVVGYNENVNKNVRSLIESLKDKIEKLKSKNTTDSLKNEIKDALRKEFSENTIKTMVKSFYLIDEALYYTEQSMGNGVIKQLLVPSKSHLEKYQVEYNTPFEDYIIYDKDFVYIIKDTVEHTVKTGDILVKEEALDRIMKNLKMERAFEQEILNTIYEIIDKYMKPNLEVDKKEVAERKEIAANSVLPIKGKVIKNTEIIRKHQVVTENVYEKLRSLNRAVEMKQKKGQILRIFLLNAGKIFLVIISVVIIGYFIKVFDFGLIKNNKHMLALACIVILQMAIIRAGMFFVPLLFEGVSDISGFLPEYIIPTALGSLLVSTLFNLSLTFIITIFTATYFGIALGFNHQLFLFSLFGGLITGLVARNIRYRWDFFRSIPPVIIIYSLFIGIWHIMSFNGSAVSYNLGLGVANCIVSTFLAMMILPVFENFFDITTDMTLVELSDMNHPLLKKLSIEAPGTYNHSILVANLAESAAQQVDANPLLVRVASYYHDIGKLKNPNYFVENQKIDKNVHSKLTPNMSALIISSHVKEGVELARKYRLPSAIRDIIVQHHGTSTVSFFYEKALEKDPHKQVKKKDFSYAGPKPQSKESAIIMLADSIEAASRSLASSSPGLLRELVKKIIHDKFSSSQLDECDITFQGLNKIINGFMPVLQGIFHTRIDYSNKQ